MSEIERLIERLERGEALSPGFHKRLARSLEATRARGGPEAKTQVARVLEQLSNRSLSSIRAYAIVKDMLDSKKKYERRLAIGTLTRMMENSKSATPTIWASIARIEGLRFPMRLEAASRLHGHEFDDAIEPLLVALEPALERDEAWQKRNEMEHLSMENLELVLERTQERLDNPRPLAILERSLSLAHWTSRRAILSRLDQPAHAPLLPTLASLAYELDASTREAIIGALGRMGHPGAEPILHALAEHHAEQVGLIAHALAEVGTPNSMLLLGTWREEPRHRDRRDAIDDALRRITERYGLADSGSLSLAEDDALTGALALAGASAGDVSLYERTAQALARLPEPVERSKDDAITKTEDVEVDLATGWANLGTTPRSIPLTFQIRKRFFGDLFGFMASVFVCCGALLTTNPQAWGMGVFLIVIGVGVLTNVNTAANTLLEYLRTGAPSVTSSIDRSDSRIMLTFMDEQGRRHVREAFSSPSAHSSRSSQALPVLYDRDDPENFIIFEDVKGLEVLADGSFVSTWQTQSIVFGMLLFYVFVALQFVVAFM